MPAADVEKIRKVAELRIHVDSGCYFEILNHKFPHTMHNLVSDMTCVNEF